MGKGTLRASVPKTGSSGLPRDLRADHLVHWFRLAKQNAMEVDCTMFG